MLTVSMFIVAVNGYACSSASNRSIEILFFFLNFILLCSDGEVRVDSLSPAHTLSSVPSPCSLEALSPYSLQVSPCGLLFVLYSFLCSTLISNANATIGID